MAQQENLSTHHIASDAQINEHLGLLLNSLPMVLYSALPYPGFTRSWVGENIAAVSGFSIKQFQENPSLWMEHIHPEDSEGTLKEFGSLFFSKSLSVQYRWLCADGTYHWFLDQAIPVVDEQGKPKQIVGHWLDITKQKHSEDQVREQAALLQIAQDAMVVLDLEDTITFWNRSAEHLYEWTSQEAVGKTFATLLFTSEQPVLMEVHKVLIEKGEWAGEFTFQTKSGKNIECSSRWKLVLDPLGVPESIFVANTDIRERKKLDARILHVQRMESISTLASGIAHDLNNIFSPILMGVSILKEHQLDEGSQHIITTIESNVNRGAEMVRQINSFGSGIEGKIIALQPKHFIQETEKFISQTFPKSIHIHVSSDRELWTIHGEVTQLRQILLELCVNARDAMPKGGTLTITSNNIELTEPYLCRTIEINPGRYVTIKVTDTGKGIPPALLDKIFEPYYTDKRDTEHRGLGLASALGVMQSLNGYIDVQSTYDHGSEFTLYFPSTGTPVKQEPVTTIAEKAPRGNGELILVVDDEIDVLMTTKELLKALGYEVITAMDGTEATAIYLERKSDIAVVLTDAMMPFMDGPTMTRALQKINPGVKVVFMSGLPEHKIDMETAGNAVKGYLQKPFVVDQILHVLHNALHNK